MGILINDSQIGGGGATYIDVLEALYPIGSLYLGTQDTCPLETLGIGTWTKLNSGRLLQISDDSHTADTTIEAGLPNITGRVSEFRYGSQINGANGAFNQTETTSPAKAILVSETTDREVQSVSLDASRSSSIYGRSSTVQPPAYVINVWKRTL